MRTESRGERPIMPMESSIKLEYAPAPPRRRKWLRRMIFALMATLAAATGWRWGPSLWQQTQLFYWQRECLNYVAPADQIVYEEDPAAVAKLLAGNSQYGSFSENVFGPNRSNGPIMSVHGAALVPSCWDSLRRLTSYPSGRLYGGPISGAVVFLHERTSPSGTHRLICVLYFPSIRQFTPQFIAGFNTAPFAIAPATLMGGPKATQTAWRVSVVAGPPKIPALVRVFAGQIDPNDPSHFTVRYQMWGQEDILDGRLNDNDRVTLTPRKMPDDPQFMSK